MRNLLLFLFFAATLTAQENVYHKGVVMDSLPLNDSIGGSYALYLPSEFDGKKQFPALFIFDGEGRGTSAARLFQPSAKEQGYILVSSNNVDPSKSLKDNLAAAATLVQEVSGKLPIDFRSISVAGMGDGAKIATALPLIFNGIHGVIFIGDHFFNFDLIKNSKPAVAVGMVGNQQASMGDLELAAVSLNALSIPTQLYVFEGGMEWPEPALISSAVGNLTLQAMRSKKRPGNPELVNKLYRDDMERAERLISSGNYLMGISYLDDLTAKYDDLVELKELRDKLKQLEKSDEYVKHLVAQGRVLEKEQRLLDDFVFYYNEDVEKANFENLGWWNFQKLQLEELTKDENALEASMGHRLLGVLKKLSQTKLASFETSKAPLEEKLMAYMLATVIDQQDYEAYKKIISLSTLNEDFPTALFYLEELLKNGYKDMDALYEIEGTLGLKLTRDYNWLIRKYLGSSRYFDNATNP